MKEKAFQKLKKYNFILFAVTLSDPVAYFWFQTAVSYIASGGSLAMLEALAQFPAVDFNFPDKEGNAPLHFAAQAGKLLFGALLFSCEQKYFVWK